MNEPKHQTITDIEPMGEEMITIPAYILISHLSYLESLGTCAVFAERRKPTSEVTFMADLISSIGGIWKETKGNELIITITGDKYHNPALIRSKFLKERTDYGLKRR